MHQDDGPEDMDELLDRGAQVVPATTATGQVAGLGGLMTVLTVTVSVLDAGTIVAGGVVLAVGGMLVLLPLL